MAIIAKNIIVGGQMVEEKVTPPPKPVTDFEKLRKTSEVKVEETPEEKYKHVHHGDLHRLFNTKSSYLKDMASLED